MTYFIQMHGHKYEKMLDVISAAQTSKSTSLEFILSRNLSCIVIGRSFQSKLQSVLIGWNCEWWFHKCIQRWGMRKCRESNMLSCWEDKGNCLQSLISDRTEERLQLSWWWIQRESRYLTGFVGNIIVSASPGRSLQMQIPFREVFYVSCFSVFQDSHEKCPVEELQIKTEK